MLTEMKSMRAFWSYASYFPKVDPGPVEMLRAVPLFSDLDPEILKEIDKLTDDVSVPAGQVICGQGQVGYHFYFILEGTARVEKDGQVVNHMNAQDGFLGELALVDKKPRSATVIAETKMRLRVVEARHFDRLLEITPGLWKAIALALCKYVRAR